MVFELGLLIGSLGLARTFMVVDQTAGIKIPSDLAGITQLRFQPPTTANYRSAIGHVSTQLAEAMAKQAKGATKSSTAPVATNDLDCPFSAGYEKQNGMTIWAQNLNRESYSSKQTGEFLFEILNTGPDVTLVSFGFNPQDGTALEFGAAEFTSVVNGSQPIPPPPFRMVSGDVVSCRFSLLNLKLIPYFLVIRVPEALSNQQFKDYSIMEACSLIVGYFVRLVDGSAVSKPRNHALDVLFDLANLDNRKN